MEGYGAGDGGDLCAEGGGQVGLEPVGEAGDGAGQAGDAVGAGGDEQGMGGGGGELEEVARMVGGEKGRAEQEGGGLAGGDFEGGRPVPGAVGGE